MGYPIEREMARGEILAALEMVLAQVKASGLTEEALEPLHSLAIATQEYMRAEIEAERPTFGAAPDTLSMARQPTAPADMAKTLEDLATAYIAQGAPLSNNMLAEKVGMSPAVVNMLLAIRRHAPALAERWRLEANAIPVRDMYDIARHSKHPEQAFATLAKRCGMRTEKTGRAPAASRGPRG